MPVKGYVRMRICLVLCLRKGSRADDSQSGAGTCFKWIACRTAFICNLLFKDFGPAGEFYHLSQDCYLFKSPGYVYEICPYANATQVIAYLKTCSYLNRCWPRDIFEGCLGDFFMTTCFFRSLPIAANLTALQTAAAAALFALICSCSFFRCKKLILVYYVLSQSGKDAWLIGTGGELKGNVDDGYQLVMGNGKGDHCPQGKTRTTVVSVTANIFCCPSFTKW